MTAYPRPMQERPQQIADAEVAALLRSEWRLDLTGLSYLPVGFGGYHWLGTDTAARRWFVTVQEQSRADPDGLAAALETAAGLAAAGLDFVVPPLRSPSGRLLALLGCRHAVSVFAYHEAEPGHWGDTLSSADRAALAGMLGCLHRATPTPATPVRGLQLACRHVLDFSLRERDVPWCGGPFAEPARVALAGHADTLASALDRFDALVAEVSGDGRPLVITHGEPHPGNLLRCGSRLLLVDWDTVGLAPPERDLWWLAGEDGCDAAGSIGVSQAALELYRLRWALDDIGLFLAEFRAPHQRSADTEVSFAGLQSELQHLG